MLSIKHRRSTVAFTAALVAGATALTGVSSTAAPAPTAKSHRSEARTSGHSEARGYYDSRTAGGTAAVLSLWLLLQLPGFAYLRLPERQRRPRGRVDDKQTRPG